MKKMFLMLIAVTVGTLSGFAQSDLVATLSHGSNLSTYYGADALSEAYTAAAEGDVITLSPGTFNAVNIEKAITVRGAGMMSNKDNENIQPTRILGNFMVIMQDADTRTPSLESVRCLNIVRFCGSLDTINKLKQVNIIKCYFDNYVDCWNCNAKFVCCIMASIRSTMQSEEWGSIPSWRMSNTIVDCLECVIKGAYTEPYNSVYPEYIALIKMRNCIAFLDCNGYSMKESSFENCILKVDEKYNPLPASCIIYKCVFLGDSDKLVNVPSANNTILSGGYESIFKTLTDLSTANELETYELTPTAAATYLGDDGKQVGIYGGTNPFDPTPSNPQIKKFTVDSSVNSGKLSVKINVE